MLKKTFICPYCFNQNKIHDIEYRCINKRCGEEDDLILAQYNDPGTNLPVKALKTFRVKGGGSSPSATCPDCKNITRKRICPTCHNELPESSINGRDMIISIVGSRATGKSHYIGVLIKELRDRIVSSYDGSMEEHDHSFDRWQNDYANQLYTTKERLSQTTTKINNANTPYIFKLRFNKKKSKFCTHVDVFTIVFFDTAGEDLNDADTMSTINKYICKSSGIIFLLDPTQIPEVVNAINDDDVIQRASGTGGTRNNNSNAIMTRVSNLIRNDKNKNEDYIIDIPVAAVFSKFDVLFDHDDIMSADSTVFQPSPHCAEGTFDENDATVVHQEIQGMLEAHGESGFVSQVKSNYKNYRFFGASSLGKDNNPDANGRFNTPAPHRIEDALLWLLKENGVIKVKK